MAPGRGRPSWFEEVVVTDVTERIETDLREVAAKPE
jgi:hypothetical protein